MEHLVFQPKNHQNLVEFSSLTWFKYLRDQNQVRFKVFNLNSLKFGNINFEVRIMKRVLVLLSFFGLNFLFSQDSEIPVPKYDREFKYSIKRDINTINFFDIDDLINVFISDFEFFKKCYLLSRKIPKEYESKLENFFNNLKNNTIRDFDFDLNQDGVLGISKSIFDDSKITLTINPKLWSVSSTPKRLYVLYHELGHDVLNFKHGQGGKMMFTLSQSDYTLKEFYNDRGYMFFKFFEDFFKTLGYDKLLITQNGGCFISHFSYNEKNGLFYYLGKPFTGTKIIDWSLYYNSENNDIEYQEIKQGRLNGKYTKTTNEGLVLETGNYIQKFISGDEYPYVKYPVGEWKDFYPNGIIKNIKNYNSEGELFGDKFEYYKNGNIKEKVYYKDKKGYHEEFFENGNLKIKYQYDYELYENFGNKFEYYDNGNIKEKVQFVDGLENGNWDFFFENGVIKRRLIVSNGSTKEVIEYDNQGKIVSLGIINNNTFTDIDTKYYFLNGNLKSIGKTFFSSESDEFIKKGKWIYYNEDGSISKEEYYNDNGELIKN